jgi:hypothetical protein
LAREKLLPVRNVGRAQNAGQPRGLQRCQLIGPLPEVQACRRPGPAQSRPPVDRIEVELEDAGLAERALHFGRIEQFAQLACNRAFSAGEKRARELLRQRARPTLRTVRVEIGQQQRHFGFVDTRVFAEALILGRDHRRRQVAHAIERYPARLAIAGYDTARCAARLCA